ncbi:MAG: glycerophosphodiester phosphodiesterase family protein [Pseudomonadota bacterium]
MRSFTDFITSNAHHAFIVAHRGAWHNAPENSLAAIAHAIEHGYDIAEIDVQCSQDGILFLYHDDTMTRMTTQHEDPQTLCWHELQRIHLRARNGGTSQPLTDQRIVSLEEVLMIAKGKIFLDLDIKYPSLYAPTITMVHRCGMSEQVDIKMKIRHTQDIEKLLALREEADLMVMPQMDLATAPLMLLTNFHSPMIEVKFDTLQAVHTQAPLFRDKGIALWVNTLDEVGCPPYTDHYALQDPDGVWGVLYRAGVRIFQTDEPETLQAYTRHTDFIQNL